MIQHETFFANRTVELGNVNDYAGTSKQTPSSISLFESYPAFGLTSFLRYSADLNQSNYISIYTDCANSVANNLFSEIILTLFNTYKDIWERFNRRLQERYGESKSKNIIGSALEGIPYLGPILKESVNATQNRFEVSNYPSAISELLCEFLQELTEEKKLIIFLDNAQEIDPWSMDLLHSTISNTYKKLYYVIGYVNRDGNRLEDSNFWHLINSIYEVKRHRFYKPDGGLVQELCGLRGISINLGSANAIATASNGNMYKIIHAINDLGKSSKKSVKGKGEFESLSPVAKETLVLLKVAGQKLRRSDLLILNAQSETVPFGEIEVEESLSAMEKNGLLSTDKLPDGDRLYQVSNDYLENYTTCNSSLDTHLYYSNKLYEYFLKVKKHSNRHSLAEVCPLLYRLSKDVDPDGIPGRIQDIIYLSLQMGSIAAGERFVESSTAKDTAPLNYHDFIVRVSFLVGTRCYEKANKLLSQPPKVDWLKTRASKTLLAITYNRCRDHQRSEELIDSLLNEPGVPEEKAILATYKISGLLHQNRVFDAQAFAENYEKKISDAINFGYFLRNSADVFPQKKALKLISKAISLFRSQHDDFGLATSLNNRAIKLCALGDYENALKDAVVALDILEVYGVHHLHIINNNIGICYLFRKEFSLAERHLRLALKYARNPMPYIFSSVNLSAYYYLIGDHDEACKIINGVREDVDKHKVDRVRQQFYINAALINLFSRKNAEIFAEYCELSLKHPDRMDSARTMEKINAINAIKTKTDRLSEDFFLEIFSPCYLAYWYQNPLAALPNNVLSSETII